MLFLFKIILLWLLFIKIKLLHLYQKQITKTKMATTTALIDILTVNEKAGIYTVEFWDESCENENFATIQISEDSLHTFIEENDLNRETFINSKYINLECDGMDERVINVFDYLENNLQSTIKEYIQFNS